MKFTIDAPALAEALKGNVARKRSTLPIFENVLIEAGHDTVSIVSCDSSLELEVACTPESTEEPGALTCTAYKLEAAISGLSGAVVLSGAEGKSHLLVEQTGRKLLIPSLPATDYPRLAPLTGETPCSTDPASLAAAIARVAYAAGKDDVRLFLNGVHLCSGFVAASNGQKVSMVDIECAAEAILPVDAIPLIIAALNAPGAKVFISESAIEIAHDKGRLRSALIDGSPLAFKSSISIPHDAPVATFDRQAAEAAIFRVATLAEQDGAKLKPLFLRPEKDRVVVYEAGGAEDSFPAEFDGNWPEISISAELTLSCLKVQKNRVCWTNTGNGRNQQLTSGDDAVADIFMPRKI